MVEFQVQDVGEEGVLGLVCYYASSMLESSRKSS